MATSKPDELDASIDSIDLLLETSDDDDQEQEQDDFLAYMEQAQEQEQEQSDFLAYIRACDEADENCERVACSYHKFCFCIRGIPVAGGNPLKPARQGWTMPWGDCEDWPDYFPVILLEHVIYFYDQFHQLISDDS